MKKYVTIVEEKINYNSCRNRHCPKYQSIAREKWIYNREQEILNVKYFHVVFTIPSEIYLIAKQNEKKYMTYYLRQEQKHWKN